MTIESKFFKKLHKIDVQGDSGGALTVDGVLAGLVSRGGSEGCAKVTFVLSIHDLTFFVQDNVNVFDIFTEVAAFMKWINGTIMSMGGMQACDLVLEKTHSNTEGEFIVCFLLAEC